MSSQFSPGQLAQIACVWEATARKPGNVHRYRDFDDLTYLDFVLSASVIAPALDHAASRGVGPAVLDGVKRTRAVAGTNTNLGILLLLAPLAAVAHEQDLKRGVETVLANVDVEDSEAVYEAIRIANPGGMGQVRDQDVHERPTLPLREIMRFAVDRDLIARQYANGFEEVFQVGVPALTASLSATGSLETAIIATHLELLTRFPDSLIARKLGVAEAEDASGHARAILHAGWPETVEGKNLLNDFDSWLRAKRNLRNPGTTADLVTASLFASLREEIIDPRAVRW